MTARRTTIRQLTLTEVVDRDTPGAMPVSITTHESGTIYHSSRSPTTTPASGATPARSGSQAPFHLRRPGAREGSCYGSPGVVTHQIRSWSVTPLNGSRAGEARRSEPLTRDGLTRSSMVGHPALSCFRPCETYGERWTLRRSICPLFRLI